MLELLLCLAVIALALQLFPSMWWSLAAVLDVRQWSRMTWFLVNVAFVAALIAVRLAPEARAAIARRHAAAERRRKVEERKRQAEDRKARWARRIHLL